MVPDSILNGITQKEYQRILSKGMENQPRVLPQSMLI